MDLGKRMISHPVLLASLLSLSLGIAACGKGREEDKADEYPAVQNEPADQQPSGTMGSTPQPTPPPETAPSPTEPPPSADSEKEETPPPQ